MNQKEINVLTSLANDAAALARRIQALTWEFDRMMTEDTHTRTGDQTYVLDLIRDAMRRSGEEMTTAVTISDRIIAEVQRESS